MKPPFKLFRELLFPPRCAACGKLQAPSAGREVTVLCPTCTAAWRQEIASQCPACFLAYDTCRCSLPNMKQKGIEVYVKLAPYGGEGDKNVARRIVLRLKDHLSVRTVRFLAAELAPGVRAAIEASERTRRKNGAAEPLETVVCHLPRQTRNRRRAGFDQAEELARALASELGFTYLPLLKRVRDGVPQKELSRSARAKNLQGAFALTKSVKGLRVLLVDDVVTTGAGMAAGAALLDAIEKIAVSIAFTEKKMQK